MNKEMFSFTVLLLTTLLLGLCQSQKYVRPNGTGSTCTESIPCTVEECVDQMSSDSTIIMFQGVYTFEKNVTLLYSVNFTCKEQQGCVVSRMKENGEEMGILEVGAKNLVITFKDVEFKHVEGRKTNFTYTFSGESGFIKVREDTLEGIELNFDGVLFTEEQGTGTVGKGEFFFSQKVRGVKKIRIKDCTIQKTNHLFEFEVENNNVDKTLKIEIEGTDILDNSNGVFIIISYVSLNVRIRSTNIVNNTNYDNLGGAFKLRLESNDESEFVKLDIRDVVAKSNFGLKGGAFFVLSEHGFVEVTIKNTKCTDNRALDSYGGFLYVYSPSNYVDIKIYDSEFTKNYAISDGGAVFVFVTLMNNYFFMQNCTLTENKAKDGGGIFLFSSSGDIVAQIIDCVFRKNEAFSSGGGICFREMAQRLYVELKDTKFVQNTAGTSGGGMGFLGSKFISGNVSKCLFDENHSSLGGASFIVSDSVDLKFLETEFYRNDAENRGGGINIEAVSNAAIELSYVKMENSTAWYGADMYLKMKNDLELNIQNCEFGGGKAQIAGGIFYFRGTDTNKIVVNFEDSIFRESQTMEMSTIYMKAGEIDATLSSNDFTRIYAEDELLKIESNKIEITCSDNNWIGCQGGFYFSVSGNEESTFDFNRETFSNMTSDPLLYYEGTNIVTKYDDSIFEGNTGKLMKYGQKIKKIEMKNLKVRENLKGVELKADAIVIDDCLFIDSGDCVCFSGTDNVTISKGRFSQCSLNFHSFKNLHFSGGDFIDNEELTINEEYSNIYFNPFSGLTTKFEQNKNSRALEIVAFASVNGKNVKILNNKRGGLYLHFSKDEDFLFENSQISENTGVNGGGILVTGNLGNVKQFKIRDDVTLEGNIADYGGGIFFNVSRFGENCKINGHFTQNEAKISGGGAYYEYSGHPFDYKTVTTFIDDDNLAQNGKDAIGAPMEFEIHTSKCEYRSENIKTFYCRFEIQIWDFKNSLILNEPYQKLSPKLQFEPLGGKYFLNVKEDSYAISSPKYKNSKFVTNSWVPHFNLISESVFKEKELLFNITLKRSFNSDFFLLQKVKMKICKDFSSRDYTCKGEGYLYLIPTILAPFFSVSFFLLCGVILAGILIWWCQRKSTKTKKREKRLKRGTEYTLNAEHEKEISKLEEGRLGIYKEFVRLKYGEGKTPKTLDEKKDDILNIVKSFPQDTQGSDIIGGLITELQNNQERILNDNEETELQNVQ